MGISGAGKAFGDNYIPISINFPKSKNQQKIHYGPVVGRQMPQTMTKVKVDNRITTGSNTLDIIWGALCGYASTRKSGSTQATQQAQQVQQQPSNNNQLQNLRQLFGAKFEIVQDSDGRFSATNKATGELVANNDTYEDTKNKLSGTNTKVEPQGTTKTKKTETEEKPQPTEDNKYGTAATAADINGYKGAFIVHDGGESRVNGDIKRDTSSVEGGSEKDFPKKIKVGNFEYKFERMDGKHAIYSSVSGNGDEYRLEKNSDGTLALNQYEGDKGFNEVDISAKRQKELEGG